MGALIFNICVKQPFFLKDMRHFFKLSIAAHSAQDWSHAYSIFAVVELIAWNSAESAFSAIWLYSVNRKLKRMCYGSDDGKYYHSTSPHTLDSVIDTVCYWSTQWVFDPTYFPFRKNKRKI